jgi:signal transduction histidine kinase
MVSSLSAAKARGWRPAGWRSTPTAYSWTQSPPDRRTPRLALRPATGPEHVAEEVKLSRKVLEGSAETRASTLLRDFAGEAIGRIAVSRRKPLSHPRLAELLLKLVAPRAASELLRRKAEYALRESEQQLFGEQALLGENTRLVRQLIAAQERERAELARELHDELSQHLTAIRAFAGAIQRDEAPVRERVQAAAQAIENSARAIYEVSHRLMEGLHPNILDAAGIVEAIASLLDGWGRQHPEIEWRASLPHNLAVDRASLRVAIYRIVQECLSNVSRHAGAQRLRIVLATRQRPEGNWLRLIIRDDGAGMDAGAPRAGFGLLGMRETDPQPRRFAQDHHATRWRHPRAGPPAQLLKRSASTQPETQRGRRQFGPEREQIGIREVGARRSAGKRPRPGPPRQAGEKLPGSLADEYLIRAHRPRNVGDDAGQGEQRLAEEKDLFGKAHDRGRSQRIQQRGHPGEPGETARTNRTQRALDSDLPCGRIDRLTERVDCRADALLVEQESAQHQLHDRFTLPLRESCGERPIDDPEPAIRRCDQVAGVWIGMENRSPPGGCSRKAGPARR